jgi:hypothetical protein
MVVSDIIHNMQYMFPDVNCLSIQIVLPIVASVLRTVIFFIVIVVVIVFGIGIWWP